MTGRSDTVVICSFLEPELVQRIRAAVPGVTVAYEPELLPVPRYPCDHTGTPRPLSKGELARWQATVAEADVAFDFDWLDPASMPARCQRLRWIQATSAGIGAFMGRTGLDRSGISVTTAAGVHAVPLAEFTLTGILYFTKGIPELERWRRAHHWERYATEQVSGSRVLVVGLGGIGRRVASALAGLGMEVWGLGRDGHRYDVPGVSRTIEATALDAALPHMHAVVLACPLTTETRGLLGRHQIELLRPDAVLVNISRGQVVDQEALYDALKSGAIRGACLDVFTEEPLPPGDPMWDLENVLISPHSASTVETENATIVELFVENLHRLRRGEPLRNVYDPAAGY